MSRIRTSRKGVVKEMKIQPLGDRKGGIVLPDSAKEKPQEGKVVAVGKGKVSDEGKVIPLEVKVGDKILYGKYSGAEVTLDEKEYLIIKEEDVLAVVK